MTEGHRYFLGQRDREEYAEACGRIRPLEKRLLTVKRQRELSAAADIPAALHLLRRWGWLGTVSESAEEEWEGPLVMALKESDRALITMDPRPAVTAILVAKYDLLNLCAVLKARVLAREFPHSLHPRGTSSLPSLEVMANRMNFSAYPRLLAAELSSLGDVLISGGPGEIADAVTAARHRALRAAAEEEGSRLFCDYLAHLSDVENIKLAFRSLAFPELWGGKISLLPGGHLERRVFAAADTADDLKGTLARTVYGPLLERCREEDGRISLGLLERETDDFLTALLEPARYVSLGPEPLWAYWLARETDIKSIRAILIGLRSRPDGESLGRRLRRPYV